MEVVDGTKGAWWPSFLWSWRQPARHHVQLRQGRSCNPFLCSGLQYTHSLFFIFSFVSYLYFNHQTFKIFFSLVFFFCLFWLDFIFCESSCTFKLQESNNGSRNSSLSAFSSLNSCSCMQMQANMLRIYPAETLPSMKTLRIVLFKSLWPRLGLRAGGGVRGKRGRMRRNRG